MSTNWFLLALLVPLSGCAGISPAEGPAGDVAPAAGLAGALEGMSLTATSRSGTVPFKTEATISWTPAGSKVDVVEVFLRDGNRPEHRMLRGYDFTDAATFPVTLPATGEYTLRAQLGQGELVIDDELTLNVEQNETLLNLDVHGTLEWTCPWCLHGGPGLYPTYASDSCTNLDVPEMHTCAWLEVPPRDETFVVTVWSDTGNVDFQALTSCNGGESRGGNASPGNSSHPLFPDENCIVVWFPSDSSAPEQTSQTYRVQVTTADNAIRIPIP